MRGVDFTHSLHLRIKQLEFTENQIQSVEYQYNIKELR